MARAIKLPQSLIDNCLRFYPNPVPFVEDILSEVMRENSLSALGEATLKTAERPARIHHLDLDSTEETSTDLSVLKLNPKTRATYQFGAKAKGGAEGAKNTFRKFRCF